VDKKSEQLQSSNGNLNDVNNGAAMNAPLYYHYQVEASLGHNVNNAKTNSDSEDTESSEGETSSDKEEENKSEESGTSDEGEDDSESSNSSSSTTSPSTKRYKNNSSKVESLTMIKKTMNWKELHRVKLLLGKIYHKKQKRTPN